MLLAAGLGERLRPLTLTLPKPAIPVLGRPMVLQILFRLADAGVARVVVNLHHLPEAARSLVVADPSLADLDVRFSHEPELLGTGGGLRKAADSLRGNGAVLVHNGDALSDVPLREVLDHHRSRGLPVTMVVAPHRDGYTPVSVEGGRVVAIGGKDAGARWLFTGIHVLDERMLDALPPDRPSDVVRDLYLDRIPKGEVGAFVHEGFWWEFGSPAAYLDGSLRLARLEADARARVATTDPVRRVGDAIVACGAGADLHAGGVALRGTVVLGMASLLAEASEVEDSVVLPEAWIGPGTRLRRVVVGPGAEIPAGLDLEELLVASDPDPSAPPPAGCERLGSLLARRLR